MIELLLLVCLRAEPDLCQERHLTFTEPGLTPIACAMQAQPTIAAYMRQFPHSRVARWKCGPAGRTSFGPEIGGQSI